ncbi:MAG: hypothetical protein JWR52_1493 [Marmoricola sp.]|nr:hypothetical protein [Marmoricola sp.]
MFTDEHCESRGGVLVAVLLNPPATTTGNRTRNATEGAARILGYDSVEVVNLCKTATSSVVELNDLRADDGWTLARHGLKRALRSADGVLGAWGVAGMSGAARGARDKQVEWFIAEAERSGFATLWMVGGEPRHPSRWHQYLADKYGRTSGGTFEERLGQVIEAVSLATL